ncbi:MAG: hypothetical protein ACYTGX_01960 [Planctomycetota bacterium]|jgi:tetratricopeptide (TPR) repeat protein
MADVTKLVAKADEAAGKRNYDYAIELYLQALTLDPDNGGARASLRRTQLKRVNEQGGGGALGGILAIGSKLMAAINGLSKNYERQAICLEAVMRRTPTSTGTAMKLARALYQSGAKRSARAVFEAIPEWDGRNVEALKGAAAVARELATSRPTTPFATSAPPAPSATARARSRIATSSRTRTRRPTSSGGSARRRVPARRATRRPSSKRS